MSPSNEEKVALKISPWPGEMVNARLNGSRGAIPRKKPEHLALRLRVWRVLRQDREPLGQAAPAGGDHDQGVAGGEAVELTDLDGAEDDAAPAGREVLQQGGLV